MTRSAEAAADRIGAGGGKRAVNVHEEMVRATFEVISDVTLSGDSQFDQGAMHKAIDNYIDAAGRVSLFDMLGMPGWVPVTQFPGVTAPGAAAPPCAEEKA